jgi:hypothetical protein
MTIQEAYIQFLNLVNRNATNNRTSVDKPRFVMLFNDIQNRYVVWNLEKRNEDSIRNVQALLIKNTPLTLVENKDNYSRFTLPENYFEFANLTAKAKTDCCEADDMLLFEVKSEDVEEKLVDTNHQPSFEYRETFYHLGDNSIVVYKKDFTIEAVKLTYYRYPVQVDIEGIVRPDQTTSGNVDPEFDDKVVGIILLAMAKEFAAINSETAEYQLNKDRLFTI